jgi:hypothetical protein
MLDVDGQPQAVADWPDERRAERVTRLATRLIAVELFDLDTAPRAELTAVWHRVPHTRSVSMGAGLALTLSGVPTYVVGEARP